MSVYAGAALPTAHISDDGEPIIVATSFHIPAGTAGYPMCTGARLYIPPADLASFPNTFTMGLWRGLVLSDPPETSKVASKGAGGWIDVLWDTPQAIDAGGMPVYIGYAFGTLEAPSTKYVFMTSPQDAAIVAPDGKLRITQANPNVGWRRSLFTYNRLPDSQGADALWGVDLLTALDNAGGGGGGDPVPDPLGNTATVETVTVSTGWTTNAPTIKDALSDGSSSTYATSPDNPANSLLEVHMEPLAAPGAGMGCRVNVRGAHYVGPAASASLQVRLVSGSTVVATSAVKPVTATPTDIAVDFAAADVVGVNWDDVVARVTVSTTG